MAGASMNDIKSRIKSVTGTMQITKAMELVATSKLRRARENIDKSRPFHEIIGKTIDEINAALADKGDGFIKAMWCGDENCEDKVKELTGAGSRCMPLEQEEISDTCVCCGKKAQHLVYWGKAY